MFAFVVRRLAYSVPVLVMATMLVFVFVRTTTDPLARLRSGRIDAQTLQRETTRLGLDRPLAVQYARWLRDFVRGRWGESYVTRRSVGVEIRSRLWNTLQLIGLGVVVSITVALAVSVFSALRPYSLADYGFTALSFVGLSMPVFWFALIAIEFLAFRPKTLLGLDQPIVYSVGMASPDGGGLLDYLRHAALPVMTLSVQLVAGWSRYERASLLDAMSADYVRTARAKGLTERRVVVRHALRNALIPFTTVVAIDLGALFGGLIVTETIFSWPGMGRLFYDALLQGDIPVLLPWLVVAATFIILFNLLADALYFVLDPRIRR